MADLRQITMGDREFDVPEEYVELTQAEYNALSPEEKNNGKVYFVTDGQGGGVIYKKGVPYSGGGGNATFDVTPIPQGPTGAHEINAVLSNKDNKSAGLSYVRQADGALPNTVNLRVRSGLGEDSLVLPTKEYVDSQTGDLTALETTAQDSLVGAVNELKSGLDGLGEPFRVKQWGSNSLNVEIPYCTEDIANTDIPKMVFRISDEEGVDYQIIGMLAYEVFDAASGGNRINCWPVCQFTGNGQKELSVRWMCGGTTRKTAKRINAWVLLKRK